MKDQTTQALQQQVTIKDKRFRVAQSIFMILVLVALSTLLGFQYSVIDSTREQLDQQKVLLEEQKKAADTQSALIQNVNDHIDCIVLLFTQPNRANLTIGDINTCRLTSSSDGATQLPKAP